MMQNISLKTLSFQTKLQHILNWKVQIEGVVADYGLTLGHCIGVINTFFLKLGIGKQEPGGVRGGTHGQILLRACTVYISDSEPDKLGSLPESSCTNPTPDNFVFHSIILNTNLSIFFSRFSITIIFICMFSLH